MLRKILIANRGEIAIRVVRACRELGVASAAVFSEADRDAPHVQEADEATCIGPPRSRDSYLNIAAVVEAAVRLGADGVHPGYGFLSENARFAQAVVDAGLTFIGPPPAAIAAMSDKVRSHALVGTVGVPTTPKIESLPAEEAELARAAEPLGFPLLVKASAGGGGRGIRLVRAAAELPGAIAAARREAESSFGDGRVFLERYVEPARHIEVQVVADQYGRMIHLGERECSIQRRHQKVIEECPSPAVDSSLRGRLTAAALAVARSVDYANLGTVEFLVGQDGSFYFLEMNTRLQVEHPVTEWVFGCDAVQAQIRIAAGEPLWLEQHDVVARGHAIEARICAEDPAQGFMPCPGRIEQLREPQGPGVRVDSGIRAPYDVPTYYDPLLAKVSVWAPDRAAARRRLIEALRRYEITGIKTNVPFLLDVLRHPLYAAGQLHVRFVQEHFARWPAAASPTP